MEKRSCPEVCVMRLRCRISLHIPAKKWKKGPAPKCVCVWVMRFRCRISLHIPAKKWKKGTALDVLWINMVECCTSRCFVDGELCSKWVYKGPAPKCVLWGLDAGFHCIFQQKKWKKCLAPKCLLWGLDAGFHCIYQQKNESLDAGFHCIYQQKNENKVLPRSVCYEA